MDLPTDGSGAGFFGERCNSDSDGSSSSSSSDSGGDSGGGSYGGGGGGHTPLHLASAYGHAAVVRALTEAGACVRAQGGACDDTPLHLASAAGQVEAMAALLEAGADVDAGDEIGNTALPWWRTRGPWSSFSPRGRTPTSRRSPPTAAARRSEATAP